MGNNTIKTGEVSGYRAVEVRLPTHGVIDPREVPPNFDGVAIAELLRAGVELAVASRRADPGFRGKVEAAYADAVDRLTGREGAEGLLAVVSRPLPASPTAPDQKCR